MRSHPPNIAQCSYGQKKQGRSHSARRTSPATRLFHSELHYFVPLSSDVVRGTVQTSDPCELVEVTRAAPTPRTRLEVFCRYEGTVGPCDQSMSTDPRLHDHTTRSPRRSALCFVICTCLNAPAGVFCPLVQNKLRMSCADICATKDRGVNEWGSGSHGGYCRCAFDEHVGLQETCRRKCSNLGQGHVLHFSLAFPCCIGRVVCRQCNLQVIYNYSTITSAMII